MLLRCPADIAEMFAGATLLNRAIQAFFGHADQLETVFIDVADGNCDRRVANKTFERGAAVDREYVTFFQNVIRRKAVYYLFVDRGADRIWKTVVTLKRRQGAGVANHLLRDTIELDGGDTGFDQSAKVRQHESGQMTRGAHLLEFSFRLPNNHLRKSACICGKTLTISSYIASGSRVPSTV